MKAIDSVLVKLCKGIIAAGEINAQIGRLDLSDDDDLEHVIRKFYKLKEELIDNSLWMKGIPLEALIEEAHSACRWITQHIINSRRTGQGWNN